MKKILVLFVPVLILSSCVQEGPGGDAIIHFQVKHHDEIIPFAMAYIKYDAKESPGIDTTAYDDAIITDALGHGEFDGLHKGDYYLYGVGWDSSISAVVLGGIPIKIKKAAELFETDLPVTE